MTPRRKPKPNRLTQWSRRLTAGRLALGRGRRPRRSRRLKVYEAAVALKRKPDGADGRFAWLARGWVGLVGLWLVGLLGFLGFGTDWFYVYDIDLVGAQRLTKAEVYNRSNLEGWSLFWLNPGTVAARLEADPLVARAVVSPLPPQRVRIQVQERVPVAVWQSAGQSFFVDAEGTLFALRGDASGMLVVRDMSDVPVQPGDRVDPIAVRAAEALARLLPERRAFDWETGRGLSFLTEGKWPVIFGDHTRLAVKVAALQAFKEQLAPDKEVLMLDLSVPEHPYYQVAPGTDTAGLTE